MGGVVGSQPQVRRRSEHGLPRPAFVTTFRLSSDDTEDEVQLLIVHPVDELQIKLNVNKVDPITIL